MKKILIFLLFLLVSCQNNNTSNNENIMANEKITKTILALGDSLTAGYNLELNDSYPIQLEKLLDTNGYNYEVINAGVSGNTSEQLLDRIDLYLNNTESIPEIAILVIGGNDGLRGMKIEDLQKNIDKIINKLKENDVKVILGGMKVPPNLGIVYSYNFFNIYEKIADDNDIYLIDFFLEGVAGDRSLNLGDGIHPNKKGYQIIAQNIFDFLENNKLIKNDGN